MPQAQARRSTPDPQAAAAPSGGAPAGPLSGRGQPRQARAIARRQAILDATLDLLAGEGMGGLSTSAIAARAGVPVASVYAYFPNKFAIVAELGRQAMAEVDARLETVLAEASEGADLAHVLGRAIDVVLAGYRDVAGRRRLFSALRTDEMLTEVQRQSDLRMVDSVAAVLALLRPDLAAPRRGAIAATLVHAFTALQHQAVTCEDDAAVGLLVEEWRRLVMGYMGAYLQPG